MQSISRLIIYLSGPHDNYLNSQQRCAAFALQMIAKVAIAKSRPSKPVHFTIEVAVKCRDQQ